MTLDNGNVVKPEMVMGKANLAQDFMAVFLPGPEYIPSFLELNQDLLTSFSNLIEDDDAKSQTRLVHHSMPMSCLKDSSYQTKFLTRFHAG